MKYKIVNALIWLAIIGIVIFWAWLLEQMSPGTPFQAFFTSVLLFTPVTLGLIMAVGVLILKVKNGEPIWIWQEPKPKKLPLWYRVLSKIFR